GVVPAPDVSPNGADVVSVIDGELIEAAWGTAVASDLSELWDVKVNETLLLATNAPLTCGGALSAPRSPASLVSARAARSASPPSPVPRRAPCPPRSVAPATTCAPTAPGPHPP